MGIVVPSAFAEIDLHVTRFPILRKRVSEYVVRNAFEDQTNAEVIELLLADERGALGRRALVSMLAHVLFVRAHRKEPDRKLREFLARERLLPFLKLAIVKL